MDREALRLLLAQGLSLEAIGRRFNRHPSTVGYWLRRHGLEAGGASKFAARGAPDRAELERLAATGASLRQIGEELDRSIATVRHWLRVWDIARAERPGRKGVPGRDPEIVRAQCKHHGSTRFRLEGRGYYRCMRCRQDRVSDWRRRTKARIVFAAGGRCEVCGYDACQSALQFHHLDPETKSFALSNKGLARSFAEIEREAAKCALLCANCHAEVESGHRTLAVRAEAAGR